MAGEIVWKEVLANTAGSREEKENFLKMLRGEKPDWVPNYADACNWVFTGVTYDYPEKDPMVDFFGVEWLLDDAGEMPRPDRKYLEDITEWRSFVHFPDLDKIDFQAVAEKDLAVHDPNKVMLYCPISSGGTIFIPLMNMMGFENGLCALLEEPEACHEFFDAVITFTEDLVRRQVPIYKPDVLYFNDDIAASEAPFVSMEVFHEMFKPYFQRLINLGKEFGIPVMWHMCGHCQPIMEEMVEMGVSLWESAQSSNDLAGMQKKFGHKLIIIGGWDFQGPSGRPGASEEVVRQSVRDVIDELAPAGTFVFWNTCGVGTSKDMAKKMDWTADECRKYGREFYKNR